MNNDAGGSHNSLWLSMWSTAGSIASAAWAHIQHLNKEEVRAEVGWLVSLLAAMIAIVAGYYTIKEKRLNIRLAEQKLRREEAEDAAPDKQKNEAKH